MSAGPSTTLAPGNRARIVIGVVMGEENDVRSERAESVDGTVDPVGVRFAVIGEHRDAAVSAGEAHDEGGVTQIMDIERRRGHCT